MTTSAINIWAKQVKLTHATVHIMTSSTSTL